VADAAAPTIEQLPLDQVDPAPDNPRATNLGDLDELAASIAQVGVLQPVTVTSREGRFLVVYGHRRLAASKQAGLTSIPAILQEMSEAERIARQTIENLHREDLSPLQEATAIANLRDTLAAERDGTPPGQRELADMLGVSQSHISKRLALLELTPKAQAALQDGTITVMDAQQLHRLKDMPKLLNSALQQTHNIEWAVDQQLREHEYRVKRGEAQRRLKKAGVTIIPAPEYGSWYQSKAKPLAGQTHYGSEEVKVDAEAHAAEKCHAAVIGERGDVTLVCTSPNRHRKDGESPVKTGLTDEQKADRKATIARNKAVREARDARNTYMTGLLKRRIPLGKLLPHVGLQWLHHADGRTLEVACDLLEIEVQQGRSYWFDYRKPLLEYAAAGPDAVNQVALALALAASEQQQRTDHPQWDGEHLQRHFGFLEAHGYPGSEIERQQLKRHRPHRPTTSVQADTSTGQDSDQAAPTEPAGTDQ
jgi:ParB family transcriptional regulator, chromosome partitioning protein